MSLRNKPALGTSACLLGEAVRFDAGHKHDRWITGTLSQYFDLVSICPEVAIGLGIPRPPIQLKGAVHSIRVVGSRDPELDVTDDLRRYGTKMAIQMDTISGYIFKSKSPSCGLERVRLFPEDDGAPSRDGVGQYAAAFTAAQPLLPVEEEGRLNDPVLRDNFIERVLCFHRWQQLQNRGITPARLIDFHSCHKLLVLSHGVVPYRALGRLVADTGKHDIYKIADDYIQRLMRALKRKATRRSHANVLQHLQGYLKRALDRSDRQELVEVIDHYRLGRVPLVVPMTLLRHHFRRHPDPYITRQIYLNPHPPELMLRNLI
ncbi:MAG TPA: hypothetical protein DCQ11_03695 [Gammaproteobacteria bacterium]|nr:hypothetical protein [Gammaproteobacteria bacterium]